MAKRFLTNNDIGVSNSVHDDINVAIGAIGIMALDKTEMIIVNTSINFCAASMYFNPDSMIGREAVKK